MKKPEHFPAKTELDGSPILEPKVDEEALKRANSIPGNKKRKSFAERAIGRAGKKNKPAEFFPLAFDYLTGEAL
mgnify:CR=1 FL=1